jgi:hypothetical protein
VSNVVKYLEGRIAITRSPTVDAGDVRVVKAIGKFEGNSRLNALENCVVLPTRGERSLASMMGGGDLDGGEFSPECRVASSSKLTTFLAFLTLP